MKEEYENYDQKFLDFDRSVLTSLLAIVSPTPQKAAHDLLERFPSFQHATRADHSRLSEIIGESGARLLRTIPDAVTSMTRETATRAASYILAIEAAEAHFSALLNGRRNEALAVIYLNAKIGSLMKLFGKELLIEVVFTRAKLYGELSWSMHQQFS